MRREVRLSGFVVLTGAKGGEVPWDENTRAACDGEVAEGLGAEDVLQGLAPPSSDTETLQTLLSIAEGQ